MYAFHYYIDDIEYIAVLDFRPVCKGREFCNTIVKIIKTK